MRFAQSAVLAATLFGTPAIAEDSLIDRYFAVLEMGEVFDILHAEGIKSGQDMAAEDAQMSASPAWTARLELIYDRDKMADAFRDGLAEVPDLEASEEALAFFETDLGRKIIEIEIEARRALSDEEVEEAVGLTVEDMRENDPDRIALYEDFIEANDLINGNVSGALNSNLAFYRGMATHEQFRDTLTDGFMISSVWEQEPEIRTDMENWTIRFTALAYSALSEAEMESYVELSRTEAGKKLNAALFAGYDDMFERQSYDLGRATAEFTVGEDT